MCFIHSDHFMSRRSFIQQFSVGTAAAAAIAGVGGTLAAAQEGVPAPGVGRPDVAIPVAAPPPAPSPPSAAFPQLFLTAGTRTFPARSRAPGPQPSRFL